MRAKHEYLSSAFWLHVTEAAERTSAWLCQGFRLQIEDRLTHNLKPNLVCCCITTSGRQARGTNGNHRVLAFPHLKAHSQKWLVAVGFRRSKRRVSGRFQFCEAADHSRRDRLRTDALDCARKLGALLRNEFRQSALPPKTGMFRSIFDALFLLTFRSIRI